MITEFVPLEIRGSIGRPGYRKGNAAKARLATCLTSPGYLFNTEKGIFSHDFLSPKRTAVALGIRTARTDVELIHERLKLARDDYEVRYGKEK